MSVRQTTLHSCKLGKGHKDSRLNLVEILRDEIYLDEICEANRRNSVFYF